MTTERHTPGPWEMGPWVDSLGGNIYRVVRGQGRSLGSVSVYGRRLNGQTGGRKLDEHHHAKTFSSEECEANARLIAAAPDLLEALKAMTALQNYRPTQQTMAAFQAARAAIAKAEGR